MSLERSLPNLSHYSAGDLYTETLRVRTCSWTSETSSQACTPLCSPKIRIGGARSPLLGDLPLTITEIPPERRAIRKLSEFSGRSNPFFGRPAKTAMTNGLRSGHRRLRHAVWCYRRPFAAANISSARARTRTSSVKLTQRTIPDESTKNSAGRAMSCPSGPPPACSRW